MNRNAIGMTAVAVLAASLRVCFAQQVVTLRDAVTLAKTHDPRLLEAEAKHAEAADEAGVLAARFGPTLFTGAGAVYTNGFPQTPGGAPPSIFSLGLNQTLFDGVARGRKRAAVNRVEIGRVAAGGVRDAVTVEAAAAYLELTTVRHALERLRSAGQSAERIIDGVIVRLQEGRALPFDVLQARLAAARIARRIVELEGRELVLDGQLHLLTGLPWAQPMMTAFEELPLLPDRSVVELVAMASANDPDIKAAELERQARAELVAGEQASYWPSIDLVGNYALLGRFNNFDTFYARFQRHNLNIGVEAKVPVFNASTGPGVALARSQLLESDATVRRRRDAIELSVRQAVQQTRDASAGRKVAEIELAAAQENVRVLGERVAEGRADRLESDRALIEEGRAWDGFLASEMQQQRSQLQLRRITGELARLFP